MSFTTNIKEEIARIPNSKSESISELAGFLRNNGEYTIDSIDLITENATVAKRIYQLMKDIYDISCEIENRKGMNFSKNNLYLIMINDKVEFILKDLSIIDENEQYLETPDEYLLGSEEEIRAYLRGAFLAKGSINDPKTSRYHLEYLIEHKKEAELIKNLLNQFDLNSKVLNRDKGYMVYVKEAEKIGDFLRIISANQAVMYYEDIRIYRDHKNMTNRLNNCEQANIDKIIETATKQIADIEYLKSNLGIDLLDEKTKQVMEYRQKYPEASLLELSEIITYETGKSITKSGLNHRFRKIKELVSRMKDNN
ncbi:MAG: DNA-binding protein WhiA [bacterium]|nr:DNA-binding protein WhiA [bacterium]